MNLQKAVQRTALLLGIGGAICGALAAFVEFRPIREQMLRHYRFEKLANSQAVQDARNCWKGVLTERGCNEEKTGPWGAIHQIGATPAPMAWSVALPNSQAVELWENPRLESSRRTLPPSWGF
jgi:hypothetical protein